MVDRTRVQSILSLLKRTYPNAKIVLKYRNPWELLVAVILSAQCTDVMVNKVTQKLFAKYPTASDFAKADRAELEAEIRSTGFFRNKTKRLIPIGFHKFSVFLNERLFQTLVAWDKLIAETAFNTQTALIDTHIILAGYAHQLVINHIQLYLAAAAAIRAGGGNPFYPIGSRFDTAQIFSKRAGGADLQTFSA